MLILPFWTSYVIRSYSWLLVLSENGVINQILLASGLLDAPIGFGNSRGATVLGFVHFFVMLLTLTIYANLVQIKESYRKAAADLGASPLQTFLHVTLPLSLPGVAVGAFLTFVLAIGDYITPQILGGGRELLLPQAIMLQIEPRRRFPDGVGAQHDPDAGGERGLSAVRPASADGAGVRRHEAARHRRHCSISPLAIVFIFLPVVMLVQYSFQDGLVPVPPFRGFSLRWYEKMLANRKLMEALGNSVAGRRPVARSRRSRSDSSPPTAWRAAGRGAPAGCSSC